MSLRKSGTRSPWRHPPPSGRRRSFFPGSANPILDWFSIGVTTLGSEEFYLIAIPILYWCVEKKFAFKLGMVFLYLSYVNDLLKVIFQTPRPDPSVVRVLYPESGGGYAFPSGHSAGSRGLLGNDRLAAQAGVGVGPGHTPDNLASASRASTWASTGP